MIANLKGQSGAGVSYRRNLPYGYAVQADGSV